MPCHDDPNAISLNKTDDGEKGVRETRADFDKRIEKYNAQLEVCMQTSLQSHGRRPLGRCDAV